MQKKLLVVTGIQIMSYIFECKMGVTTEKSTHVIGNEMRLYSEVAMTDFPVLHLVYCTTYPWDPAYNEFSYSDSVLQGTVFLQHNQCQQCYT